MKHPLVRQIEVLWDRGDHTVTIAVLTELPEFKVYSIVNEIVRRRHVKEKEILEKYSTPGLRKNELNREAKRRNMEFDSQYDGITIKDREAFLDLIYGTEEKKNGDENER